MKVCKVLSGDFSKIFFSGDVLIILYFVYFSFLPILIKLDSNLYIFKYFQNTEFFSFNWGCCLYSHVISFLSYFYLLPHVFFDLLYCLQFFNLEIYYFNYLKFNVKFIFKFEFKVSLQFKVHQDDVFFISLLSPQCQSFQKVFIEFHKL